MVITFFLSCLTAVDIFLISNFRMCCSYLPTSKPIISEGNEMLVLMKANGYGSFGFQAKVWAGMIIMCLIFLLIC